MFFATWIPELSWSQTLLVMVPLVVIMWGLRYYDAHVGAPKYSSLTNADKCWMMLTSIKNKQTAAAMCHLEASLLRAYMVAGRALPDQVSFHRLKVLHEFLKSVKGSASDEEVVQVVSEIVAADAEAAVKAMQSLWTVEPLGEEVNGTVSAEVIEPAHKSAIDEATSLIEVADLAGAATADRAQKLAPAQPNAPGHFEPLEDNDSLKPIAILNEDPECAETFNPADK